MFEKKYAVVSLSGGMDSATLLLHLLALDYTVIALSFDYGQKHKVELDRAEQLVMYLNESAANVDYTDISHRIIKIAGLAELLDSALVTGGEDVPEGHYEQENMKATVVPNRNKIFSSILQAVALSISNTSKCGVIIALGIHAGDHAIYPDCRKEFIDADLKAFRNGNWNTTDIFNYMPYLNNNKFDILKDGQMCCEKLGVDFNEVYKRTNTSYKPILHAVDVGGGKGYLDWFSDYKSASSVERIEAFIKLGVQDPVPYANEDGPVPWAVAKAHVENVLKTADSKNNV